MLRCYIGSTALLACCRDMGAAVLRPASEGISHLRTKADASLKERRYIKQNQG